MVRSLADVLPSQAVVVGCRFNCNPDASDASCPDRARHTSESRLRVNSLIELPVGASEDRVLGSLDLGKALGAGEAAYEPGLLAAANRGVLYIDEVNLLRDHLVDVLLDVAAMGRNIVEHEGVSVSHAARIMLVGTMNPEEGELRPQLLDRFGLAVEVAASREPQLRAEIVRRRLAADADPEGFTRAYAAVQRDLVARLIAARDALPQVLLGDEALFRIARVCVGFEVDGMRADLVTARAATAHVAWCGRTSVTREDVRVAALLALPHRRRRNSFDMPHLDEELLDRLLGDDWEPEPEPPAGDLRNDSSVDSGSDGGDVDSESTKSIESQLRCNKGGDFRVCQELQVPEPSSCDDMSDVGEPEEGDLLLAPAPVGVVQATDPFSTKLFLVRGIGSGIAGWRSHALATIGRTVGVVPVRTHRVHLLRTIVAAALRSGVRATGRLRIELQDVRGAVTQGREVNLILFVVDASGSMAAMRRMEQVKQAVLSLLLDAYRRRDQVGMVTFRGSTAELILPPTGSVDVAASRLAELGHGGRTPLAEGLACAAHTLQIERIRDPHRRALMVLVTDGRATSGLDALQRAFSLADRWSSDAGDVIIIDCETGRFRMGLAVDMASRMGAQHVALEQVCAQQLIGVIDHATGRTRGAA